MLERVPLFTNKRDVFHFFLLAFTLFALSLSYEFYNYKELTKFDSQLIDALVLKQYTKTKLTKKGKIKHYQVLKLKSDNGFTFYTSASSKLPDIRYKKVQLEAWAGEISFYEYLHGFYAHSKILQIYDTDSYREKLNRNIDAQHKNSDISLLYQALFSAKQLPYELQKKFSNLGISHLIAISGFHLSVLGGILFFLLKYPYKFLQNRYFPYRSYRVDSFWIVALSLYGYLLFLDTPPSLLRAIVMLIIGFILYDRGVEIISMQTLLLTAVLIIALAPRLLFSIGFWLSVAGVFYIFLFLIYFWHLKKLIQFLLLPFWVYLLMLPYSLALFGNFSIYHPLSILWTSLFTLFYPLGIFLHLLGFGYLFDDALLALIDLGEDAKVIHFDKIILAVAILLSLGAVYKRSFLYLLLLFSFSSFIYAIYYVT